MVTAQQMNLNCVSLTSSVPSLLPVSYPAALVSFWFSGYTTLPFVPAACCLTHELTLSFFPNTETKQQPKHHSNHFIHRIFHCLKTTH